MNNSQKVYIIILAGIIFFISKITFAGYILEKLTVNNLKNKAIIMFDFNQLPKYKTEQEDKKIILIFSKTSSRIANWPTNIQRGPLNAIEASLRDEDLVIELKSNKKISYHYKEENSKFIIEIYENNKDPENASSDLPFKIPSSPKKIDIPLSKHNYHGQLVSIDVQNADVKNILRLLAQIGGFNLVLSDDVQGKITLSLHNVPWDQALDLVLASKGLGMVKTGNVIRIAPLSSLLTETEQLAKIKEALSREESAAPLKTVYLQIHYAKAADLVKQIESLLTDRGSVTFDERTNKVILKDVPAVIKKAEDLIAQLDEPVKQVLIEARIVEITNNLERRLGIKWSGAAWKVTQHTFSGITPGTEITSGEELGETPTAITPGTALTQPKFFIPGMAVVDLGVSSPTTTLGFTLGRLSTHSAMLLDVQLSAMEEEGLARIISTPHIITMDHLEAEIKQGFQIPYLKQTQDGISTEFIDAGLTLKVIPHVTPDNRITLEIETEKSAPDFSNTVNGVPTIITRSAKSQVLVENGETIVIGGIMTENLSESHGKVPGLGDLPGIGNLFKNKEYQKDKSELLIFITARVVTADVKDIDY